MDTRVWKYFRVTEHSKVVNTLQLKNELHVEEVIKIRKVFPNGIFLKVKVESYVQNGKQAVCDH